MHARVLLALVIAIATTPAFADEAMPIPEPLEPDSPVVRSERAQAAYNRGEFLAAIIDFKAAFELDPKPEYLFGWAQAVRKNGDCPGALVLYRKLLEMTLGDVQLAATRQAMSLCPSDVIEPPPKPLDVGPSVEPWYRDSIAHVFVVGGAIALGAGGWATVRSVQDERDARAAREYGEHERLTDRAITLRIIGIAGLAVGAVAATYGIYRYTTHREEPRRNLNGWIDRDGGGILVGGTWP